MTSARAPGFVAALRAVVRGDVREQEALARWSTYRIGGPATVLFPSSVDDVSAAITCCNTTGVPWFPLGLGSNLLFPDDGLDALVMRMGKGMDQLESKGNEWSIGAGVPAPLAAKRTAAAGFGGIHQMVGVPGSVGGGIVMNAGCHGAEWRDVVRTVYVVDERGAQQTLTAEQAGFSYRRSKLGQVVVVRVDVALHEEAPAILEEEIESLYQWRKNGTPFNQPCCGSVFKNPELPPDRDPALPKTSGQFLESAGMKCVRVGGIEVSPMHANYFVNTGNGSAGEVRELMKLARAKVADQWGVVLDPEVKLIDASGAIAALA